MQRTPFPIARTAAPAAALLLVACGGGGGAVSPAAVAPLVASAQPEDGERGVSLDVVPAVEFDADLRADTVDERSVVLRGPDGPVAGAVRLAGERRVQFEPEALLDPDTDYEVALGTPNTGVNGAVIEPVALTFRTVPASPRVVETDPLDDASDVPIDGPPFRAIYDADLDAGSIAESVTLHAGDASVPVVAALASPRTVEVVASELEPDTAYSLVFTDRIRGTSSAPAVAHTVVFRTEPSPLRPLASDPEDGASDVPLDAIPLVVFDGPLDPGTIAGGVELTQEGLPVGGFARPAAAPGALEFVPVALEPGLEYLLVVSSAVLGADGVPVEAAAIRFTTVARPEIDAVHPDLLTEVPRDAVLRVDFDQSMDPASILDADTIALYEDGERVPADVAFDPASGLQSVLVAPEGLLAMIGAHELRVEASVRSEDGLELGVQHVFPFVTEDGAWRVDADLVTFDVDPGGALPAVALSANGEATALFRRANGRAAAARSDLAFPGPWTLPIPVGENVGIRGLRVATDDQGRALAVWRYQDEIRTNRFDDGGWQPTSELLSLSSSAEGDPELAMTPDGMAIAVWPEVKIVLGPNPHNLGYRVFRDGEWSPTVEEILSVDLDDPIGELAVDMGADGRPVVAFAVSDGGPVRVRAAFSNDPLEGGFTPALPIDDPALVQGDAVELALAVESGVALACWIQASETLPDLGDVAERLWVNRLALANAAWDQPQIAFPGFSNSFDPAVALNGSIGTVVWGQEDGGPDPIGTVRIDATVPLAIGMEIPDFVPTDVVAFAESARPRGLDVALDGRGNGLAVFRLDASGTTDDVFALRYHGSDDLWSLPVPLELGPASANDPSLAMAPDGRAVAVWHAGSPGHAPRVEANVFD